MEKRLILAIVLSFALLALYWIFFLKPAPVESPAPIVPQTQPLSQAPLQTAPEVKPETQPATKPAEVLALSGQAVKVEKEQTAEVETPLYHAVWSNKGAVLKSWKLKKYNEEKGGLLELVNVEPDNLKLSNRYPFFLDTGDRAINEKINNNQTDFYQASTASLKIREGRQAQLAFVYDDGAGIHVEKKFMFNGYGYDFEVSVSFKVNGEEKPCRILWGPGIGPASQVAQRQRVGSNRGFIAFASGKEFRLDERKFKPVKWAFFKEEQLEGKSVASLMLQSTINWAAYEETYFTALFLTPSGQGTVSFNREIVNNVPYYFLSATGVQKAYLGPKELDRVKALDPAGTTKKLVQFGFFGSIVEILLVVIRAIYRLIPNWGLAIVILTVITKILFFPLTYSSTKSMAKMQELQPKIKALRAKYKKSKTDIAQRRQMNEEMMQLYKAHGVNPAGGCLPLLIQLPVFWAIWRLLSVSIELRHSPFVFWIKDLSVKDPFLVTPILMGITQFISQKMTPTSADPAQSRMMLIMPVIMTFFFLGFPSGLVLYWLTSNVLQILQQHVMNRLQKKREAHEGRRKK